MGFTTLGQPFDVQSVYIVRDVLADHGFDFYGVANDPDSVVYRWPYPSAFLPWIVASDWLADQTGVDYHDLIQLPAIAADAAIAWVVQWFLGRRGAGDRVRLSAAAAVMLGLSFAVISGYHTQIDSIAILPAVIAICLWVARPDDRRRWLCAGLLVGTAAALKTTPILAVLALLPSARSVREGASTLIVAAAVPIVTLLPFLVADSGGVAHLLDYQGTPGAGGLSMVLDPGSLQFWLTEIWIENPQPLDPNRWLTFLTDASGPLTVAVFAAIGAFLVWARADAVSAALLVWLGLYVFGPAFFLQYLVWGLPFLLLAGHVRAAVLVQLAVLVPTLLFYWGPRESDVTEAVYFLPMAGLWLAFIVAFVRTAREIAATRQSPLSRAMSRPPPS